MAEWHAAGIKAKLPTEQKIPEIEAKEHPSPESRIPFDAAAQQLDEYEIISPADEEADSKAKTIEDGDTEELARAKTADEGGEHGVDIIS